MTAAGLLFSTLFLATASIAQPVPAGVATAAIRADERDRDAREKLAEIIEALAIGNGSVVADIGAGYGYYAVRLSPVVGTSGRIYAEEIDRPLVEKLRRRVANENLKNIKPVLGKPDDPGLPGSSLDAILLADVYHEVESRSGFLRRIMTSLKPGGRLVIVEYLKPELRSQPRERQQKEHNIAPEYVEQDLKEAGFAVIRRRDPLGPGYDGIPMYYIVASRAH